MPENDYYGDDGPEMEKRPGMDEKPDTEGQQKDDDSSALLPKSFFKNGEVQPGKTYKVKVNHVHEDEVECSLDDGEEAGPSEPTSQRQKSSDSLRKIAMQGEG